MSNEIKPSGGFGPFVDPAADSCAESTQGNFQKAKDALSSVESSDASPASLDIVRKFSKADLQDPDKLDGMVRASVSELVESSQGLTGPLSAAEKQSLADFLSQDPLVRRQVESYLRKVLV